jgi:carboxyl-terminal processing protease
MRQRHLALVRLVIRSVALLALSASAAAVSAQTFVRPTLPATAERVSIATESLPGAIQSLLEKGRSLELTGRWADALSCYEEALREYPQDRTLQARFDVARLHYSLEQRYDDRSFRNSLSALRPQQAFSLYSDLLTKIETHYYTTPPWQDISVRGARAMDIALASEEFLQSHTVRVRGPQMDQLRAEILEVPGRYTIRSSRDASAVANQIARLANQRLGLSETATLLEFTAAAAGGLDHYSAFLTADQLRDIYSQIEGNFVGLGVELKADNGALLIVRVIARSPAEKAGIRAGDRIVAVDDQATEALSTDEAAALLTGVEGSLVKVAVVSPGSASRDIVVRRDHVDVPSLEDVKLIDPQTGVAYIRIPAFQKSTAADLENALWDLHRQGMRSLIIDLRGNPGGLLTASVEVADKFIAEGGIVSTRGRSEQENFNYRAHRPGTWRVPLVVMIDGDSASASEIFAGAIQDSGRGKIVGARSYGKGSVQGIFALGTSGAGARLTTARFFSPLGHPISNVGITPDIDTRRATLVANGGEASTSPNYVAAFRGTGGDGSASLANSAAPNTSGGSASPVTATKPTSAMSAVDDPALEVAIETVRREPVAQL